MTILNVPGMHCEGCVKRISDALSKMNVEFSVSLEDKTVSVSGSDDVVSDVVEALDDLGFDAERK